MIIPTLFPLLFAVLVSLHPVTFLWPIHVVSLACNPCIALPEGSVRLSGSSPSEGQRMWRYFSMASGEQCAEMLNGASWGKEM